MVLKKNTYIQKKIRFFKVANKIHLNLVTKGLVDPNEAEVKAATVAIETMAQVLTKALEGMPFNEKGAKG